MTFMLSMYAVITIAAVAVFAIRLLMQVEQAVVGAIDHLQGRIDTFFEELDIDGDEGESDYEGDGQDDIVALAADFTDGSRWVKFTGFRHVPLIGELILADISSEDRDGEDSLELLVTSVIHCEYGSLIVNTRVGVGSGIFRDGLLGRGWVCVKPLDWEAGDAEQVPDQCGCDCQRRCPGGDSGCDAPIPALPVSGD